MKTQEQKQEEQLTPVCSRCGCMAFSVFDSDNETYYRCHRCQLVAVVNSLDYTPSLEQYSVKELAGMRRVVGMYLKLEELANDLDAVLKAKSEPLRKLQHGVEGLEKAVEELRVALSVLKEGV